MRLPDSGLVAALLLASGSAGCDSFDFNRVVGRVPAASTPRPAVPAPPSASAQIATPAASAEPPAGPRANPFVVVAGGDITLGGNVTAYLSTDKGYDPLGGLRPVLEGTDLRMASLLSPLMGKTSATAAAALARAGLDVVSVANDQVWSSGKGAFTGTLGELERAGIAAAGPAPADGKKSFVTRRARGWTVAVIAVGAWPDKTTAPAEGRAHVVAAEPVALGAAVREARAAHDLVLVSAHAGPEHAEAPSAASVALAKSAIEAGADAVFAHGAGVPQGIAWIAERPVFHGLGNLLAQEDPKDPWTGRSFVAKVSFFADGHRVASVCPFLIVDGEPKLLFGTGRPVQEGVFRRAVTRLSGDFGEVQVGDPDLHSCMAVAPKPAAPPP